MYETLRRTQYHLRSILAKNTQSVSQLENMTQIQVEKHLKKIIGLSIFYKYRHKNPQQTNEDTSKRCQPDHMGFIVQMQG